MRLPRPYLRHIALAAMLALAGCADGRTENDEVSPAFEIRFEARENPEVFQDEGPGRRSARDTSGLWAVVSGLPRPESGVVRNLDNRRSVRVALFTDRPAGGAMAELSIEAADALGIGNAPVDVRVTAVRDEPQVATPRRGFGLMRDLIPGD